MARSEGRRGGPGRSASRDRPHKIGTPDRRSPELLPLLLLAAFAILGTVLVLHHEPWRDEADAWLMARDAPLADLFLRAGYVGSPSLWYYLLAPFARLGLPYATMGIVNLAVATTAVGVLLIAAPFPLLLRALVAFSFLFSYEYAVVARSYALSVMFLFALAALHARRDERPRAHGWLTALLFNTNVHGMALAAPILAVRAWETLRSESRRTRAAWQGLAIAAVGGILAVVQLLPHPDGQLRGLARDAGLRWVGISLAQALFPTQVDRVGIVGETQAEPVVIMLAALIWIVTAISLQRRPRVLAVLIGSSALLWALFSLKYSGAIRHWGFLLLAMIYSLWIARVEEGPELASGPTAPGRAPAGIAHGARLAATLGLGASLVWSVYFASRRWQSDIDYPFSESRDMAEYLVQQKLTHIQIAAWPETNTESVLPFLPIRRFYYPGIRDSGSYMKWDRAYEKSQALSDGEVLERIHEAFPDQELLLLTNRPLEGAKAAGFTAIHIAAGRAIVPDERYLLYQRAGR